MIEKWMKNYCIRKARKNAIKGDYYHVMKAIRYMKYSTLFSSEEEKEFILKEIGRYEAKFRDWYLVSILFSRKKI